MQDGERTKLSRKLAVVLRHRPAEFGVRLDDAGWADVDAVISALRARGGFFARVDRAMLDEVVRRQDKPRYEIDEDGARIRARYGHSVEVAPPASAAPPPPRLWHGTHARVVDDILRDGLRPMGRRFVHLSETRRMAEEVGRRRVRRDNPLTLLHVDARGAHDSGIGFRRAAEGVWLADEVPPRFLSLADPPARAG